MSKRRVAVLVTGSRKLDDRVLVAHALIDVAKGYTPRDIMLIHGDATGADEVAAWYACGAGWNVLPMPAPWKRMGMAGGMLRNRLMVLVLRCLRFCGWHCIVLAFPLKDSAGTWGCVRVARRNGFEVRVVKPVA